MQEPLKPPFPKLPVVYPLTKPVTVYLQTDRDRYEGGKLVMTITESIIGDGEGNVVGSMHGDSNAPILHFFFGGRSWTVNGVQLFEAVLAADRQYLTDLEIVEELKRAGAL